MKYLVFVPFLLLLISCGGGSDGETTEGNPENNYKPFPDLGHHDEELVTDKNGNEVWEKNLLSDSGL